MNIINPPTFQIPHAPIEAFCRRWKIRELSLFGSALSVDFNSGSDVDILVAFEAGESWTLLDFVRMQDELTAILGREVDLVDRVAIEESANEIRRRAILDSAQVIYAA
jgi:hypothetical protein